MMMRMHTTSLWTRVCTFLVILCTLLLAACGGGGGGSSPNTSPVKVGVIGPFSGFEAFIGPDILKGVQVAADQMNANGGILGRKANTKVNYEGASGPMDFNDHNNVFGPFDAVQSDATGNVAPVLTITAQQLNSF